MGFDPQPSLVGELVRLRAVRESDWDELYRAGSDPEIWAQHPAPDRWREAEFRAYFERALADRALVVIESATGEVIGSTRFHGWDGEASEVEIGWTFLVRRCWGGRHNGEMKRLMIAHALRSFERVVLLVGPDNARSRRAVERIGGVLDGEVERSDRHGRPMRNLRYVVTRGGAEDGGG